MLDLAEKQQVRATTDRKTFLINELYKLGLNKTRDGRSFEECTLFTLEHVHINEKCRKARELSENMFQKNEINIQRQQNGY